MSDGVAPEVTVFDLLYIGYSFATTGPMSEGQRLGPTDDDPLGIVQRVQDVCSAVEDLDLPKSTTLVRRLSKGLLRKLDGAVGNYPEAELYPATAATLDRQLGALWDLVCDEASRQEVYVVQPTVWALPFRKFVEAPRDRFGLGPAYDPELPPELDENLAQAAKHVSYRLMGGAIFFWLRAVETVLQYYCRLTLEGANVDVAWGRLCAMLDSDKCAASSQLVKALRRLKDDYRDPIVHVTRKDVPLDEETALNVLTRCRAVVEHMMQELEEASKATVLAGSPTELAFGEE